MFPKILHQTWKTKDLSNIPEFQACADSWRVHHSDYRYLLWDDRENIDFVKAKFPWYYDTWMSFDKNIKRIDSIRYMWMYVYGGIYADLDMECLRALDQLIATYKQYDTILFCDIDAEGHCLSANPALVISRPGSEFWFEILEYAKLNCEEYVTRCTGPSALGRVVNSLGARFRVKCLDQNRLFIRKYSDGFYADIPGNQHDAQVYKNVFCATAKPAKYYEDRKHKYVADWHGTPEQFRWHNEYTDKRRAGGGVATLVNTIRGQLWSRIVRPRPSNTNRAA